MGASGGPTRGYLISVLDQSVDDQSIVCEAVVYPLTAGLELSQIQGLAWWLVAIVGGDEFIQLGPGRSIEGIPEPADGSLLLRSVDRLGEQWRRGR